MRTTQTSNISNTRPNMSRSITSNSNIPSSRDPGGQTSEFSDINAHIDNVEFTLTNLNSEMKQKSALFETEMGNIQNQIKIAKENYEKELAQQKKDQELEIEEIKRQHEEEIQALETNLRKVMSRKTEFSSSRSQVQRIQKESELADLRHQLELLKIQQEDHVYLTSTNVSKTQGTNLQRETELNAQIEMLDAEINDITATRKEEMLHFKMKLDDTNHLFEKRNQEAQAKIARYQAEAARRQKECDDHILAIRNQSELEQTQLRNELETTNEKLKGLRQLFAKLQNQGNQEIQTVQRDIDELRHAIEKAKEREKTQIEETREQIAKLRGAQHDAIAIEQEVQYLKQEIEDMRKENQEMRKEKNRVESISYTTRMSKFRSSSIH